MQAVVLLAAGSHAVRGPVREIRARPGSPQCCAPGLLHGGEGRPWCPESGASAPGRSALLHPSTEATTREDSAHIFFSPAPLLVGVYTAGGRSGPPHAPPHPHGEGSDFTLVPQCIPLHLQSAGLPASRFLGGKARWEARRPGGGGRGGGAETCSVEAMGAQTMARFSAGVLSQLCATAQKTQTNEEAEASGGRPGIARPGSLTGGRQPQPH